MKFRWYSLVKKGGYYGEKNINGFTMITHEYSKLNSLYKNNYLIFNHILINELDTNLNKLESGV